MNYGLHLTHYPSDKYGFVGTIPATLLNWRKATSYDIMAGRIDQKTGLAWHHMVFDTPLEALTKANEVNANLCANDDCGCSRYRREAEEQEVSDANRSTDRAFGPLER